MTIADPTLPPELLDLPAKLDLRRTYSCTACGHVMRVSGVGRHRIFSELTDEQLDNPVMDRVCPACRQGLPGK